MDCCRYECVSWVYYPNIDERKQRERDERKSKPWAVCRKCCVQPTICHLDVGVSKGFELIQEKPLCRECAAKYYRRCPGHSIDYNTAHFSFLRVVDAKELWCITRLENGQKRVKRACEFSGECPAPPPEQ